MGHKARFCLAEAAWIAGLCYNRQIYCKKLLKYIIIIAVSYKERKPFRKSFLEKEFGMRSGRHSFAALFDETK